MPQGLSQYEPSYILPSVITYAQEGLPDSNLNLTNNPSMQAPIIQAPNVLQEVQSGVQGAINQLNPVTAVEQYLAAHQLDYLVGAIGIVVLIVGVIALSRPAIESAAKVAAVAA